MVSEAKKCVGLNCQKAYDEGFDELRREEPDDVSVESQHQF
jgi:hypothetical protein